jgi:hypothetical protein
LLTNLVHLKAKNDQVKVKIPKTKDMIKKLRIITDNPRLINPQREKIIKNIARANPVKEKILKTILYLLVSEQYRNEINPQKIKNKEKSTNQKINGK